MGPVATEETRPTKRVLILDDKPVARMLREVFGQFQHGHDYEVTSGHDAHDALVALRREGSEFDLILMEVYLPLDADAERKMGRRVRWPRSGTPGLDLPKHIRGTPGLDLLKHIRGRGVNVPVIMMTVSSEIKSRAEALIGDAAFACLMKPFRLDELERLVADALASGQHAAGR